MVLISTKPSIRHGCEEWMDSGLPKEATKIIKVSKLLNLNTCFFSIRKKKHIYPFQTWWSGVLKFEIRWQLPTVCLPRSCHSGASVLPHDCVPNTPRHGPWSWVTLRHSANLQAFGGVQSPAPGVSKRSKADFYISGLYKLYHMYIYPKYLMQLFSWGNRLLNNNYFQMTYIPTFIQHQIPRGIPRVLGLRPSLLCWIYSGMDTK